MTETVQAACQVIILNRIIVTLGIRVVTYIYVFLITGILYINGVMDIYRRNIIQY